MFVKHPTSMIIRGSFLNNYICICQFVVWQPCVCTNRICRLAILHLYQSHLLFGYPAFVLIAFVVCQPGIGTNRICRLAALYRYLSHLSFGNPAFVPIAWPHWIRNLIRALFYKECGVGASAAHQYQDWKLNYGQNLFKA